MAYKKIIPSISFSLGVRSVDIHGLTGFVELPTASAATLVVIAYLWVLRILIPLFTTTISKSKHSHQVSMFISRSIVNHGEFDLKQGLNFKLFFAMKVISSSMMLVL